MENISLEDKIDFLEDNLMRYLDVIEFDLGVEAKNEAIEYWNATYKGERAKSLSNDFIDVYALSVANAHVREFYRRCIMGFDYIDK